MGDNTPFRVSCVETARRSVSINESTGLSRLWVNDGDWGRAFVGAPHATPPVEFDLRTTA
jgi:hypothetical protein